MAKYPYPEKQNEQFNPVDYTNSGCPTECTGLIPTNPLNDAELYSYQDVYNFLPPTPDKEDPEQI